MGKFELKKSEIKKIMAEAKKYFDHDEIILKDNYNQLKHQLSSISFSTTFRANQHPCATKNKSIIFQ